MRRNAAINEGKKIKYNYDNVFRMAYGLLKFDFLLQLFSGCFMFQHAGIRGHFYIRNPTSGILRSPMAIKPSFKFKHFNTPVDTTNSQTI